MSMKSLPVWVLSICSALVGPAASAGGAQAGGWQPLVGDHDAPAFRGWVEEGFPKGWHVEHGVLSKEGPVDDLVSTREYASFELEFEWKLGTAGNAGVFYRGTRAYDHIYWSGPEYQLLDDANAPDGKNRLTSAAAAYALYAAPAGIVHAAGRWNRSRLVVNGNHVEHWLNGRKVVSYELGSEDWAARVAASKFKDYPGYGKATSGLIAIQGDHDGSLTLRGLRIRELP
jgi:hypothetical protein